jgi:hypothetical protein
VSFAERTISSEAGGADYVHGADMDNDGDMDVLAAHGDRIVWYENANGSGTFGPEKIVSTEATVGIRFAYATDLDGDGDMDVLSASSHDDKVSWYANTDGKGSFGDQRIITTQADGGVRSVYVVDVDGDGDSDVLSAGGRTVAWYENMDGKGTFGGQQVIYTEVIDARSVFAADLDQDGDQDVLSASFFDDKIAWYENIDGKGSFGPQEVITTEANGAAGVHAADLDGDGDLDVLFAARNNPYYVRWHENMDGNGNFSGPLVIAGETWGFSSVCAADLDGDGDLDLLYGDHSGRNIWYENTDGHGSFGRQQRISVKVTSYTTISIQALDLDGDGDLDVLSDVKDKLVWYENLCPHPAPGDANEDFQFDQADVVEVLQTAKYMTGQPATWHEGDWNDDAVFDQLDIVAALQTGNYLQGPYAVRSPEVAWETLSEDAEHSSVEELLARKSELDDLLSGL